MKPAFIPTILASAIAATFATSVQAIDAWDYSGAEGRANAQQLDYFSLRNDFGNIWVNPALLREHGSQVRLTIDNRNRPGIYRTDDNLNPSGVDNSGGAGGVFYQLTPNSTVGGYIGRRSNSDFRDALNFDGYQAPSMTGRTSNFDSDLRAENQFDLFYAISLPGIDVGARLNYQAFDRQSDGDWIRGFEGDAGSFVGMTGEDYVAQLNQQAAAQPGDVSVNLAAEMGAFEDFEVLPDRLQRDASEFNFSVGFSLPELGLDGAIQLGNASGTQRVTTHETRDAQAWVRLTDSEEDQLLDLGNGYSAARDQVSVDDGRSLGLALRYQVFERETEALMLALSFRDVDYSGVLTGERESRDVQVNWTEDEDATAFEQSERLEEMVEERWSGRFTSESQSLALIATYQLEPRVGTRITVSSGFVREETEYGHWARLDEDLTQRQSQGEADASVVTETIYNNPYGIQSRMDFDITGTQVPLIVALEQDLSERWTLRGSISRDLYMRSTSSFVDYAFEGIELADRRAPEPEDLDQSTQLGPDQRLQTRALAQRNERTWDNQETTVRIGVGYRRNQLAVDGVFSASLDRLFTADHKVLEDSKFARVTVSYQF